MARSGKDRGASSKGGERVGLEATLAAPRTPSADVSLDETLAVPATTTEPGAAAPSGTSRPAGQSAAVERLVRGGELGRYVILEMLGAGGMGEVYTAYDPELDRKVAIKIIRQLPGMDASSEARGRLLAEAQALARLSHPNVVTVYDVGSAPDGKVYIAMEFVDGITLASWLTDGPPSTPEVIEVLLAAARGLSAAHAAGIVHRDFKPDNVLIGKDGRVRVIDFGVALQEQPTASVLGALRKRGTSPLSSGDLVGTPAYMAPEQFRGEEIGPATDQFSFGVVLYQALQGHLPFEGDTLVTLADSVCNGEPRQFGKDSKVARWLQDVCMRALETDPGDRFSSMDELSMALAPRQGRSRRWLALGGATLAATSVALAIVASKGSPEPCLGGGESLGSVWNEARRSDVRASLGAEVFARVRPILDDYGQRWVDAHRGACEATRVRSEQPESVMALRMACLDTRLRELDGVIAVLAAGTENPVESADALGSLSQCSNLAALEGHAPPPAGTDPKSVLELESALARARALLSAARLDQAKALATEAAERARKLSWEGAESEALLLQGMAESELGDPRGARERIFEAVRLAKSAGDRAREAEAWTQIVAVEASGMNAPAEALRWAGLADIAVRRAGGEAELQGRLAHYRGTALRLLGKDALALAEYRQAQALLEHALGADHYRVIRVRAAIGPTLRHLGRLDEAEAEMRVAIERFESIFGPDSSVLGPTLNNLALLMREKGDYQEARSLLERSVTIKEASLGPEHPGVAVSLMNLALLERRLGNFDAVERDWRRAYDIRVKALGEDHPKVTGALLWRAEHLYNLWRNDEAMAVAKEVMIRARSSGGGDSVDLAVALTMQCELKRRAGLASVALAPCDEADALWAANEPNPARALETSIARVQVEIDRGRLDAAEQALDVADARHAQIAGDPGPRTWLLQIARARVMAGRGRTDEARRLLSEADRGLEGEGAGYAPYRLHIAELTTRLARAE